MNRAAKRGGEERGGFMNKPYQVALAGFAVLGVALVAGAAVSWSSLAQGEQSAKVTRGDVVMIRCDTSSPDLRVSAYQGSAAAPAKHSGSCAESISLLLKDGFSIRDMGRYSDQTMGYMVITLMK